MVLEDLKPLGLQMASRIMPSLGADQIEGYGKGAMIEKQENWSMVRFGMRQVVMLCVNC